MHADTRRKERFQSFESGLVLLRHALARGPEALNSLEREGAIRRFEARFEDERIAAIAARNLRIRARRDLPVTVLGRTE